ncbi:hypothetical protein D3C75_885220 [compost metagenome]
MLAQHRHQPFFILVRHARPLRVLEMGHQPAGLDRILLNRLLQRIQIDPMLRMGSDRHRFQLQAFQRLQRTVKCRGFNRHRISRLRHRLQAEA